MRAMRSLSSTASITCSLRACGSTKVARLSASPSHGGDAEAANSGSWIRPRASTTRSASWRDLRISTSVSTTAASAVSPDSTASASTTRALRVSIVRLAAAVYSVGCIPIAAIVATTASRNTAPASHKRRRTTPISRCGSTPSPIAPRQPAGASDLASILLPPSPPVRTGRPAPPPVERPRTPFPPPALATTATHGWPSG